MQRRKLVWQRSALQLQEMQFSSCFPDGVMENILVRLPIKPLIRFKSVCKSWKHFLSCPYFVQMQIDYAKRSQKLLIYSLNTESMHSEIAMVEKINNPFEINRIFTPFELNTFDDQGVIEDSCDGLVSFKLISSPKRVYLWNPATRESRCVKLPYMDVSPSVGIAFVAKSNEFKMVRIPNYSLEDNSSERKASVWVYSLNSCSWKELKLDFKYETLVSGPTVVVGGCMHWLTTKKVVGGHILAFDVENEVLKYLPLPDTNGLVSGMNKRQLGVVKGLLSVVMAFRSREFDLVYDVWQMSDYGVANSWRKVASIPKFREIAFPVGFHNDGILFCYFRGNDEDVFVYDLFTRVRKHFHRRLCSHTQIVNYTETLASLKSARKRESFVKIPFLRNAV